MTGEPGVAGATAGRSGGWLEAGLFSLALAALNISYGIAHQHGVHPVALLLWAMPIAAIALLVFGGVGDDWRQVVAHPLSLAVGGGIIGMEAFYYMLLGASTPTDGSLLVRISVPIAMLTGYLLSGRRPSRLGVIGAAIITGAIAWYLPRIASSAPVAAAVLAMAAGLVMSLRTFAAEQHPWNRAAGTIKAKMRLTGLVLALASAIGAVLVIAAVAMADHGLITPPAWLPGWGHILDPATIKVALVVGALVLTAMQYLGFSVVVKLGTERFIATTAIIPLVTLGVQALVVRAGFMRPVPVDWSVMPAMAGVMVGVAFVIAGTRHR